MVAKLSRLGRLMSETPLGRIELKVSSQDSAGNVLVVEMTHHVKGGPGLHLHREQDEWFYINEGEYILEVGGKRRLLGPGDSAFGPKNVPHAWSFTGKNVGKIIFVFTPAGLMEAFFRKIAEGGVIPQNDSSLFRAHGMELVGPPL